MNPSIILRFIENAYTDNEGESEVIARIRLNKGIGSSQVWSLPESQQVQFPTGDLIQVLAEVTPYGNYLHIHGISERILSLKSEGVFEIMFLLPCGQEAYAELVLS